MQPPSNPMRAPRWRYGSIPRINWDHPLARGLVSYLYDTGMGYVVDLASMQAVQSGHVAAVKTPYGPIANLNGQAPSIALGPKAKAALGPNPVSYAVGFYMTAYAASVFSVPSVIWDGSSTAIAEPLIDTGGFWTMNLSGGSMAGANAVPLKTYTTLAGSVSAGGAGNAYMFAGLAPPDIATTTGITGGTISPCNHSLNFVSVQNNYFGGTFYSAAWARRVLSAGDFELLHTDPFCFLIWPEDEISSIFVGAAASGVAVGSASGTGSAAATAEGQGSSSGTGAAAAVGRSAANSTGAAAGSGAATATAQGQGAASGTGAAAAVGRSTASATGSSSGTGAATATAQGQGSANGTGAATGVGQSTAVATGSASGAGTATGVGRSVAVAVGAAAGTGAAAATASATGSASGTGAASATGQSTAVAVGAAAGTGAASATGQSTASAVGSASGTGTATGISGVGSVGSASGTGTATGVGQSVASAVGSAAGTGAASAAGQSTASATGSESGAGAASATGQSTASATGSAAGTGAQTGTGQSTASATGSASGTGTATGISVGSSVGSASGTGTAAAVGQSTSTATGSASGTGTASGVSAPANVGGGNGGGTALSNRRKKRKLVALAPIARKGELPDVYKSKEPAQKPAAKVAIPLPPTPPKRVLPAAPKPPTLASLAAQMRVMEAEIVRLNSIVAKERAIRLARDDDAEEDYLLNQVLEQEDEIREQVSDLLATILNSFKEEA